MNTGPSGSACRAVSELWDSVVNDFLTGREIRRSLRSYAEAYRGRGESAVQWDALPELFLGPLTNPRGVFLGLNPGRAAPAFHRPNGKFAEEIRKTYRSYSAWAASWPYFREPWTAENPPNRHHKARLRFLRDWTGVDDLPRSAMVCFELYPWHSARYSGQLKHEAARTFFKQHMWDAIVELDAPVFAFGAGWFPILETLGELEVVKRWDGEGRPCPTGVASRRVVVLQGADGVTVIAVKQSGYAGPPSKEGTERLRDAVSEFCR